MPALPPGKKQGYVNRLRSQTRASANESEGARARSRGYTYYGNKTASYLDRLKAYVNKVQDMISRAAASAPAPGRRGPPRSTSPTGAERAPSRPYTTTKRQQKQYPSNVIKGAYENPYAKMIESGQYGGGWGVGPTEAEKAEAYMYRPPQTTISPAPQPTSSQPGGYPGGYYPNYGGYGGYGGGGGGGGRQYGGPAYYGRPGTNGQYAGYAPRIAVPRWLQAIAQFKIGGG